jgi:membrane protease YdiL (CAAX protease family)
MLLVMIFTGVCLGSLLLQVFGERVMQQWRIDRSFMLHLVAFLSLQGLSLIWMQFFLTAHQVSWAEAFGFMRAPGRSVSIGLITIIVALPVALLGLGTLVNLLMKLFGIDPQPQMTVELVQNTSSPAQLWVLGFAAVVLAPIAEEVLFRGVLFTALRQRGHTTAAWLGTSLLFGAIHMNFAALLPLMFLALVFAWLYVRTGNLLASITAHCVFNGLNFWALVASPKWLQKWMN